MAFLGSVGKALGFGSTGDVVTSISGSKALGNIAQIGATGLSNLTGGSEQGQSVAVSQATQTVPQESAQSSQASIGALYPYLGPSAQMLGQAFRSVGRLAGTPAGSLAIGTGVGAAINLMGDDGKPMRFTRKMQMQVKEMVELVGFEQTMSILGVDAATLAFMLTKKFPRRGQGITAAQLRNAQRVNNKVIAMHDKLKAAYGSTTRRTTARRTASTRVTQIKN